MEHVTGCSQCGTHSCEDPRGTVINCSDFRVIKIAKFAKHVGTMIGPEVSLYRWTAPRNKFNGACAHIITSPKILVERACREQSLCVTGAGLFCTLAAPDQATDESRAYSDWLPDRCLRIRIASLAARFQVASCSNTFSKGLDKNQAGRSSLLATLFAPWRFPLCLSTVLCAG